MWEMNSRVVAASLFAVVGMVGTASAQYQYYPPPAYGQHVYQPGYVLVPPGYAPPPGYVPAPAYAQPGYRGRQLVEIDDEEDPGVVPIIQPLRLMLDQIRPQVGTGWMFGNTIGGALDLDNLADRVIKPVLKANGLKWKGWHAYRRGLATNLHELGIPDKVIQAILRHEDVKTTQRSYIKMVPSVVTEAMRRLEEKIACAAVVQQVSVN